MWIGIEGGACVLGLSRQCMIIWKFRAVYQNQVVRFRAKARLTHCVPRLQAPSALSEGADLNSFIIQEGPEVHLQISEAICLLWSFCKMRIQFGLVWLGLV